MLLLSRAVLSLAALALGLLIVLALLDRAWLLPDAVRPWATLTAYAVALFVAWKTALRFLKGWNDPLDTARLMDAASHGDAESILSAVELAHNPQASGSLEFLAQLQEEAAAKAAAFDHSSALPANALKIWSLRFAGLLVLATLLALIPQLHLPGFLARAALPFAPLDRPASIRIEIIEPAPATTLAPFVSDVEILADIIGPLPDRVFLDIAQSGSATRHVELAFQSGSRFRGVITVGQTDLEYRLRAADAMTVWHRLSARPRPAIQTFAKTVTPPAYLGGEPITLDEDHGDIEALEGSLVQLQLSADQPLTSGTLTLNPATADTAPMPKAALSDQRHISGEFTVAPATHSWKTELVSKETGFTNEESSPWRIISIPDLPPLVQILSPQGQQSCLPDELIRLIGSASDEVGLKSLDLATGINGADWNRQPLPKASWLPGDAPATPPTAVNLTHPIPLGTIGLATGDVLMLKLVATDLKGQETESDVLRIIILEQRIDPMQRRWATTQESLARVSDRLSQQMALAYDSIKTLAKRQNEKDAAKTEEAHTEIQAAMDRAEGTAEELWQEVKSAAREAATPMQQREAALLGQRAAEVREALVPALKDILATPTAQPEAVARAASDVTKAASSIRDAARTFAAEATTEIAVQSAGHLERQEQLFTQQSLEANRDAEQRPRWQERQRAAAQASQEVVADLEAALSHLKSGGEQKQLRANQAEITEAAQDLVASLDTPDQTKSPEHLYGASDHLRQRLTRAREASEKIADSAASQAAKMREQLARYTNPAIVRLNEARAELLYTANPAKAKPRTDGQTHQEAAQKKLEAAARLLEAQADLQSQSPTAPSPLAPDISRAARAADQLARNVEAIPTSSTPEPKPDPNAQASTPLQNAAATTEKLMAAAKALDAATLAQQATQALTEAADSVHANPLQPMTLDGTERAEAAIASAEQLAQVGTLLGKDRQSEPATLANIASNEAKTAANRLAALEREQETQRQQAAKNNQPAPANSDALAAVPELDRAQESATALIDALGPLTAAAQASLDELTPAMSDIMKALAQDLQKASDQAEASADKAAANQPVETVAQEATELQPEAADNARKMESLQNALRQEANQAQLDRLDERQLSRTADVALAQMRDQAPEVASELQSAAQAQQSQPQQQSLQNAADMQQQTAQALQQLAQNFESMEQGQALTEEQLAALSEMEQALGVQEDLDSAYDRAQELAELEQTAQDDPARALAMLEKELPTNPIMQKGLAEIAKAAAQNSETNMASGAQQPAMMGLAAELAAHEVARVARHQERLGQQAAAQQASAASETLQATAGETKTQPAKATPQQGQQAAEAATQAAQAATQTAAEIPQTISASPLAQMQGFMLAQALDQLDQQLNPMQSGQPGEGQQSQQSQSGQPQQQPGQQQKGAQKSLSEAQQSQQQSMAQARNEGRVPGSESADQQMADSNKPSEADQPTQTNNSGNYAGPLPDGGILSDALLLEGGGLDWGHLPANTADDLSEATRREAAPEYRAAIESYYNAIARKAKAP